MSSRSSTSSPWAHRSSTATSRVGCSTSSRSREALALRPRRRITRSRPPSPRSRLSLAVTRGTQPSSGYERVEIPRPHHERRRAGQARPGLVLRRVSVPPRLRQSAGRGPGVSAKVRAEQDLRKGHVATDAVDANDAELSPGDLGQSDAADPRNAVRDDAARARVGAQYDLWRT